MFRSSLPNISQGCYSTNESCDIDVTRNTEMAAHLDALHRSEGGAENEQQPRRDAGDRCQPQAGPQADPAHGQRRESGGGQIRVDGHREDLTEHLQPQRGVEAASAPRESVLMRALIK